MERQSCLLNRPTMIHHHSYCSWQWRGDYCDSSILIFAVFVCLQRISCLRLRRCGDRQTVHTSCMRLLMIPKFEYLPSRGSGLVPLAVPWKGALACGQHSQNPALCATPRWVMMLKQLYQYKVSFATCVLWLLHYYFPVNPLNTELNPICKSQLAQFFCWLFKFCAWYSKNLNISRTERDKYAKQK